MGLNIGSAAKPAALVMCALLQGVLAGVLTVQPVAAESLDQALASAYANNPDLDAERKALRATDENVPQALSGYRPELSAAAEVERLRQETTTGVGTFVDNRWPRGFAITVTQPLFQGFRVVNSVKQAEKLVDAGRQALLNSEQNILFNATQAYVSVLTDLSVINLRQNNVKVLNEQLRATQDRFDVGEVTRTDIAQAEARLAGAVSAVNLSQASLSSDEAVYRQVIGHPPSNLRQPRSIANLLPKSVNEALNIAEARHPAILSTLYAAEAAGFEVAVIKGELLPTISLEGSYSRGYDTSTSIESTESASVIGRINVPIYQRGQVSSRVRQAKETYAQRRLEMDSARRQVRAAVVAAWGQLESAVAQIKSDRAQVQANEIALAGVREEASVGNRTVLDVLNAQQELLDSQVSLLTSQRDQVVASYALLSAVGGLTAANMRLPVKIYDPLEHYLAVRNKWFGLSAPGSD